MFLNKYHHEIDWKRSVYNYAIIIEEDSQVDLYLIFFFDNVVSKTNGIQILILSKT